MGHKCEKPSEKSMVSGHQPKRDLLQAGTEATDTDAIQMGCSCQCFQICDHHCPAAASAAPTAPVPQSSCRDELSRDRQLQMKLQGEVGEERREGREPTC